MPGVSEREVFESVESEHGFVHLYGVESQDQLRTHLADPRAAYNLARRLNMLSGLTPYEYIAKP